LTSEVKQAQGVLIRSEMDSGGAEKSRSLIIRWMAGISGLAVHH